MQIKGCLRKMQASLDADDLVHYRLVARSPDASTSAEGESQHLDLDEALGRRIQLTFSGRIICQACGRQTRKSYSQGYCFPCMRKLARCDLCVLSPERCHFAAGTCREPEWGMANCFIPHVVYLANSAGLKVGITRHTQVPVRWLDQGASAAKPIYAVSSRRLSGFVEDRLREWVADRTQWRKMLSGKDEPLDLDAEAQRLRERLEPEMAAFIDREEALLSAGPSASADAVSGPLASDSGALPPLLEKVDAEVQKIEYPVARWPDKIRSINPEKTPRIEGELWGIRGQYLILDTGCLNIRKFTAYEVEISLS